MTICKYGTIHSNFKPKVWYVGTECFQKYTSVRDVGTVQLTLQGTGTEYARFSPQNNSSVRAVQYVLL